MTPRNIYVIRDSLSGQVSPLFLEPNDDCAKRQFVVFMRNMQYSPGDYDLHHLGVFYPDTFNIDNSDHVYPRHVCNGSTLELTLKNIALEEKYHGE